MNIEYVAMKYGELRAVAGATTMIQHSYPVPEPRCLIRNLDSNYLVDSRIPNIRGISTNELVRFQDGLRTGHTRRVFLHIAKAKFYQLTRAGRKQIEKETQEWEQMASILARFLNPKLA